MFDIVVFDRYVYIYIHISSFLHVLDTIKFYVVYLGVGESHLRVFCCVDNRSVPHAIAFGFVQDCCC